MRKIVRWTNPSVLRFARDADPVKKVRRHAQSLVAQAMDDGWEGPPYNPLALADRLGIEVVANADVQDARIVPTSERGARIEYNPNRPIGRMRYSLAHELAHTFFPDFAKRVRNRNRLSTGDEWQLEMLCSIGAAELLMPAGSLGFDLGEPPVLETLLELRHKYNVSTEAMLIRAVSVAKNPMAAFCAHKIERGRSSGRYRLDYLIPSPGWLLQIPLNGLLPDNSVISECTAIGYTAQGSEQWDSEKILVESEGLPSYPGSTFPRIAGIVSPRSAVARVEPITYVRGSVLEPRGSGRRIIAHVVNNRTPNWGGSGVAIQLRKKWPQTQNEFRVRVRDRNLARSLSEVVYSSIGDGLTVATLIAQVGYGDATRPRIRYAALRTGLSTVAYYASERDASLHIPRIGCGQAGGSWNVVRDILISTVASAGIPITVYDPPNQPIQVEKRATLSFSP